MSSVHPKANIRTTHVRFGIQANGYLSATMPTSDLEHLQQQKLILNPIRASLTRTQAGKLFMKFGKEGSLGTETISKSTRFIFTPTQLNFKHGTIRVHAKTVNKIKAVFDASNSLILNFVEELPEKIQQRNKPTNSELKLTPTIGAAMEAAQPLSKNVLAEVTAAKEEFNRVILRAGELGLDIQVGLHEGLVVLSIEL